jgi:VanZ family protein
LQPLRAARQAAGRRPDGALLRRRIFLILGWGWVAAIFWLSLTPRPPTIDVEQGDKLGHLAAYGLLMVLFCQVYAGRSTRAAYAAGFIAMGIAIEFLQRMTGYRTFDVLDMVANAVGVLLGGAAALALPSPRMPE